MATPRLFLLLVLTLACSGRSLSKPVPDGGSGPGGQAAVERRPRWIAVGDKFDLSVVRFDDPTSPELTLLAWVDLPNRTPPASRPALRLPAQLEDDAEVMLTHISWSTEGRRLVLATRQAELINLYVASAEDGFVPRLLSSGRSNVAPRWISDDTLVLAASDSEQVDFLRMSAPDWRADFLGSYRGAPEAGGSAAGNATFTASRAGALYSLGSPAAGELWLARGQEPPRRIGAAFPQGGRHCQYRLTWSLDGQSAVWWGRTVFASAPPDEPGCQDPPPVDAVPGASPALGIEVESTRIDRQYVNDPASDRYGTTTYTWSVISAAVAGAPVGPAIAYGICQANWSTQSMPIGRSYLGTLVVKSAGDGEHAPSRREESEAAVCDPDDPDFGFINATDYFFTRRRTLMDGGLAKIEFIVNRQGQEHVVHDHLSGVSDPGVLARGRRLFFVGMDESGLGLWSVDLTAPTLRAERVAFDVAANEGIGRLRPTGAIPLLRSSEWLGGVDHNDEPMRDSPEREALLVGVSESSLIPCDSLSRCWRWLVVDFEGDPAVVTLDPAWRAWDLTWTPDGQGLLAADQAGQGVYWLTGPGYQDRYRLSPDAAGPIVPPRWPAP